MTENNTIKIHDKNGTRHVPMEIVPAVPARRPQYDPAALNMVNHTINAAPTATTHIEMKTSAVDRSKGFLISTVPLFAGFSLAMVLVCCFFLDLEFLSLGAFVVYWITFVGAWLASYIYTIALSAEGIAKYEAKRKWNVIDREQTERWKHYRSLNDGD